MHRIDRRRLGFGVAAVLVAAAIFLLIRASDDQAKAAYPPTVEKVATLLQSECSYVSTEAALLPVGAYGPPGLAFKRFGRAPIAAAIVSCEVLGRLISWYRFPSTTALREEIGRHPAIGGREPFCVKGDELLLDEILGSDETPSICRRLGFTVHRP